MMTIWTRQVNLLSFGFWKHRRIADGWSRRWSNYTINFQPSSSVADKRCLLVSSVWFSDPRHCTLSNSLSKCHTSLFMKAEPRHPFCPDSCVGRRHTNLFPLHHMPTSQTGKKTRKTKKTKFIQNFLFKNFLFFLPLFEMTSHIIGGGGEEVFWRGNPWGGEKTLINETNVE